MYGECENQTQKSSRSTRVLTDEEKKKLKDAKLVSEFKQNKFEVEAQKNWDLFYKRNTTKFFKDRHWTTREFMELCSTKKNNEGETNKILEVGCGVGNFIFPLLAEDTGLFFYACDFSPRAVQFVKDNSLYDPARCHAFQCDITEDSLSNVIQECDIDIVTMIFVLSAIHPDKMTAALENVFKILKPGGMVLFRDYGLYDHAQLRFGPGHKLGENFYVRQDGTRAYYFSIEQLDSLFEGTGFTTLSSDYIHRETVNKKEGLSVERIFVQSKYQKPFQIISKSESGQSTTNHCENIKSS
ncbi:tRNA N(3)-cytidine methyltransferase METTL6-like [Tubulanus polymorphus]|uniref:tRNA N(3)-cytidine methyltransferase METTL6-like n=1 Tax=Tubulanus polymorphus TaxID=672921 RepID=UPI003DA4081C